MVNGLTAPIDFVFSPIDPDIVYIAEKGGRIRVYDLEADRFLPDFVDLRGAGQRLGGSRAAEHRAAPGFPEPALSLRLLRGRSARGGRADRPRRAGRRRQPVRLSLAVHRRSGGRRLQRGARLRGRARRRRRDQLRRRRRRGARSTANGRDNLDLPASDRFIAPSDPDAAGGHRRLQAELHQGRLRRRTPAARSPSGRTGCSTSASATARLPNLADPRTVERSGSRQPVGQDPAHRPDHRARACADNPFVEPGDALTTNRSKVWQLGLRNPFSMGFNDDGRLFITDTGWNTYEEINQGGPGANFGWPFFEGGDFGELLRDPDYRDLPEAAARSTRRWRTATSRSPRRIAPSRTPTPRPASSSRRSSAGTPSRTDDLSGGAARRLLLHRLHPFRDVRRRRERPARREVHLFPVGRLAAGVPHRGAGRLRLVRRHRHGRDRPAADRAGRRRRPRLGRKATYAGTHRPRHLRGRRGLRQHRRRARPDHGVRRGRGRPGGLQRDRLGQRRPRLHPVQRRTAGRVHPRQRSERVLAPDRRDAGRPRRAPSCSRRPGNQAPTAVDRRGGEHRRRR